MRSCYRLSMSNYEKYFIDVERFKKIDIYRYLELLPGDRGHAIEHALKKLALCGVRTGGKSFVKDITEARDTLNRWLDMRKEDDAHELELKNEAERFAKEGNWPAEAEGRMAPVLQNGNEGEHYIEPCMDLTGVELEDWVRYVATDADGDRYKYSHEPFENLDVWAHKECDIEFIGTVTPPLDWTKTLIKIKGKE